MVERQLMATLSENLYFLTTKVSKHHLNGLVVVIVFLLLELLLQEGIGLGLLGSDRASLDTNMDKYNII